MGDCFIWQSIHFKKKFDPIKLFFYYNCNSSVQVNVESDGNFDTFYANIKTEPYQINARMKISQNIMSNVIVDLVQNGNTANGQHVPANVGKELSAEWLYAVK